MNTNIALGNTQTVDPMGLALKGMQMQGLMNQNQASQLAIRQGEQEFNQSQTLADLYRGALRPDGTIDREKVLLGAANSGLGAKIPGLQKSFLDTDKAGADLGHVKAQTTDLGAKTARTNQEVLYDGLKQADGAIASLLANPNVNDTMVMGEMGRLVRLGAFNAQAAHMGITPDEYARRITADMPVGNPAALRPWLVQAGARTADASKRLELSLPKYDEQDRGGVINEGTLNQFTGVRTAGINTTKTNTPGEVLSAETTRRGQTMQDDRARDFNDITKEGQNTVVAEDAAGNQILINKANKTAVPVTMGGQVVQGKGSSSNSNATMARDLTGNITDARDLLKTATGSPAGKLVDYVVSQTGESTPGARASEKLKLIGGWMTSNVPRMQGPQSNADTALYAQMAGRVGDDSLPVSQRLAALDQLDKLMTRQASYSAHTASPLTPSGAPIMPPPSVVRQPGAGVPAWASRSPGQPLPAPGSGQPSIDSFFMK